MGIIGVVAALTLPNLNSSTGDREKVAKVKKIYQNLTDALGRAQATYGPLRTWYGSSAGYNTYKTKNALRITEFLKITKGKLGYSCCFTSAVSKPGGSGPKTLDGNLAFPLSAPGGYSIMTADGTSVMIVNIPYPTYFYVDIDGPRKGPSTFGIDYFSFKIVDGVLYPEGYDHDIANLKDKCFKTGRECAAWVINNGNMDYLKANANGICKNNDKITLDGVNNTTCK